MLVKYKKDKYGHRIGVSVAIGRECVGCSLCSKHDRWDREKALKIAIGRAEMGSKQIPESMYLDYYEMYERSGRYFHY